MIRDVLLSGIADLDIRREALISMEGMGKSITDVIALVESKEMARNANPASTSTSSLWEYRRLNRDNLKQIRKSPLTRSESPSISQ